MSTITNIGTAGNDEAISSKFNVGGILNWSESYTQNTQNAVSIYVLGKERVNRGAHIYTCDAEASVGQVRLTL